MMAALISVRGALWSLGFRPFFLLASAFSAASVLLWSAQFTGALSGAYLQGPLWHGHEMLFGYTTAVIAGFLLTAVRNWTGEPTATGAPLMALAVLWVCGRVLVLTPFAMAAALVNAAFPLAVAVAIGIPLVRTKNARNYFFIGLLVMLAALDLAFHLALQSVFEWPPRFSLQLALDVMLFILAVMGGRVIPMFTNNGIPGLAARRNAWVERLALGAVILLFVADLLAFPPGVLAAIALTAAGAHAARLWLWQPWRTLATPLVWILHAAYAWIVVALVLRGFAEAGWTGASLATHALTAGAIGGMTLGMMARVARGHTGRPLVADGYEQSMFLLVQLAAVIRVFGVLVWPAHTLACVQLSGLLWSAAFGLYAVRYWPILSRPRADGRPV